MSALLEDHRTRWQKLLAYREFWGDQIAWKIGNLNGDEPYDRGQGQFSVTIDFNVDSGTFKEYERNPWRITARYLDHSAAVQLWRWGIWIAVRAAVIA